MSLFGLIIYWSIFFISVTYGALLISGVHQILLLILSEFKRNVKLLFPLQSSEMHRFSNDFRGNRTLLIHPNLEFLGSTEPSITNVYG